VSALIWGAWAPDWALFNKVDFDGINKIIYVNPEVTELDIRFDVYSAWVDWVVIRDNAKFMPAIRYSGYDPIGPGQYTGDTYFLTNGWKLSVDLSKVRVTGVLYSDNYATAYYTPSLNPQYPATVATVVNTVNIGVANVTPAELWAYNNRSLSVAPATPAEVAETVWNHPFVAKLLTVAKYLGLK